MGQGLHRIEKYLDSEFFLKSPWKLNMPWKVLEFFYCTVDREDQYKIVVPLFGAANAAPNEGTTIL